MNDKNAPSEVAAMIRPVMLDVRPLMIEPLTIGLNLD